MIWSYKCRNPYDVSARDNGNILIADKDGLTELRPDLESGKGGTVVWRYKPGSATNYSGNSEVFSCEIQPNGNIVATESGSLLLVELDPRGKVVKTTSLKSMETRPHQQIRLTRRTAAGTQLVAFMAEGFVKEIGSGGKVLRTIDVKHGEEHPHYVYQALPLPNGNVLVSGSDLRTVTEYGPEDEVVWRMKPGDVSEIDLGFLAGITRLDNGNTIVCNWAWSKSKVKAFEINAEKKVVWKLDGTHIKAPTSIQVLPPNFFSEDQGAAKSDFERQVEADWLLQENTRVGMDILPEEDAAGGCDGKLDMKSGFSTGGRGTGWWRVDLGEPMPIGRIVIWNCAGKRNKPARELMVNLSNDCDSWALVYQHAGEPFSGERGKESLSVPMKEGVKARYVQIERPQGKRLSLHEIQVFAPNSENNLALNQPATQGSVTSESTRSKWIERPFGWTDRSQTILKNCLRLVAELREAGIDIGEQERTLRQLSGKIAALNPDSEDRDLYMKIRWVQRRLTLKSPLLDFESILFVKRVPGSHNHMSDQYYGWWSRPGGGIFLLTGFQDDRPAVECISDAFTEPGTFLRPTLSYDGKKLLFAWCKYYDWVAALNNKQNKRNVPEKAFYSVFEMNVDGSEVRQLTDGKYDDFDAQYLPDGKIVFLSTRRGWALQPGPETADRTIHTKDLPDSYVRCGGGPRRPVAVYTLHRMGADGTNLIPISPFEMFEWTPFVADDGTIMYSRWDYVDRWNNPWMSLWKINPDGTDARLVYGNHTNSPQCNFEAKNIPGSHKIVFTGAPHHGQTLGSLALIDPKVGVEGPEPLTRLTPEAPFPEIEAWPGFYYANPWPLSERLHLVSWGIEDNAREDTTRSKNGMGLYLLDAAGNLELLYRDPDITSSTPIPLRPRKRPPILPDMVNWDAPREGKLYVSDVYRGLDGVERGTIKSLRIVALPVKTQPKMNAPSIGLVGDDPGKYVLGTVPVEEDGSAYFRLPASVNVFFQAIDKNGVAVQTMRSATHVQPGETRGCIGCHEARSESPATKRSLALSRNPSKISTGPPGSWPLRYDKLVQPVLDRNCVSCHTPQGEDQLATKLDLTGEKSYESLIRHGSPSLFDHVKAATKAGRSTVNAGGSKTSVVLDKLRTDPAHSEVSLAQADIARLALWMDLYAQKSGHFSTNQEKQLIKLRDRWKDLLIERQAVSLGPLPSPSEN
ncbi:discoidin domain-containing protein [Candidatus Hydrogenedentota bacterium]